ncbi:MAG: DNA topoisomerase (ATP-hydrolyzing) subunit A [Mycoplasmataceae bacterium]|nr:DNA topoisomerase (ATP-hydrolyzing) subunit A [Mycoplasmataceae bacterium]
MAKNDVTQIRGDLEKTKVLDQPISQELQRSFLEYAMSVIVARALPDVRDGLKPVHRRVLFAAYVLGLFSNKPHKKSARIVGEVIGKFHPHGDSAAYETMARMAQDFSMRYPLIDGHGNFGSTDDEPAAMRYTEARLSKIGELILEDIEKDTVGWVDNYDGSEKEPEVLTSIIPNMLANGSTGIAVGMATNIPPHNLNELIDAVHILVNNPEASISQIMEVLKGPDFPTGAEIIGIEGIHNYFHTGRGSVTVRSKIDIEYNDNGKSTIIIRQLPYMVAKGALIDKIVQLVKDKIIEGIADIQDFSNKDGLKICIETKKDVVPEVLLNQLYKTTQLQTSFPVNMLALVDNTPKILNIKEALTLYIAHQIDCLVKKTTYERRKASEKEHILAGLHIAASNIDRVIAIIRAANDNDNAIANLIAEFKIDEIQAKAITEMKLRSLSGMERTRIENELTELRALIVDLTDILNKKERQNQIFLSNLDNIAKRFGDNRRTVIRTDITSDIDDEDLIPKEDILITMSAKGYLKRLPVDEYRTQKRGGVGVIGAKTHEDDNVEKIITANTHTDLLLFSDFGKVYKIRGHQVPLGDRTVKGIPAINVINIEKDESILTILPINLNQPLEELQKQSLFFCTTSGIVKRTSLEEFTSINKGGKIAITLKEGDKLFNVVPVNNNEEVYIGSSNGQLVRFDIVRTDELGNEQIQVRTMGRSAAGVNGIDMEKKDTVVGLSSSSQGDFIFSIGAKGLGKISPVEDYRKTRRNSKGVKALKVTEKTGKLVFTGAVKGDEDILMITTKGKIIRFLLSSVRETGRNAQGVKLMNIAEGEKIKSVTMFKSGVLGVEEELDGEQKIEAAATQKINIE